MRDLSIPAMIAGYFVAAVVAVFLVMLVYSAYCGIMDKIRRRK